MLGVGHTGECVRSMLATKQTLGRVIKQTLGRVTSAQVTDIHHLTMLTLVLPPLGTGSQHILYEIPVLQAPRPIQ